MSPQARIAEPAGQLPDSVALTEFLAQPVPPTSLASRYMLVDQATTLLDGLYVHLRLKRAMYGLDPVQHLRLLERRLPALTDLQFHTELSAIFRSVRDLHTTYQLPSRYRGQVAALGILVEHYRDRDGEQRYLATRIHPALQEGSFTAGVEIVDWNGMPIERAVELNAELHAGSNPDARLARGLEALTVRPLSSSPPPDERWVILGYRTRDGHAGEIRLPWRVLAPHAQAGHAQDPVSALVLVHGIDPASEAVRQLKRHLFAPAKAQRAQAHALVSVLSARSRRIRGRSVGYLRLFSFNVSSARRFVEQLSDILANLPQDGLIVDIRANPGGNIPAAEGVLQLLAAQTVEPSRFSLATTPLALELSQSNPEFQRWTASLDDAVQTGEAYSQPLPLSDPEALAAGLPRYPGPIVLITDALCYSASDIFAAGFQDNRVGKILGTAERTGAGGANVWSYDLLALWLPDTLRPLPDGASFRVALRRVTRVRDNIGVPLEDLGVKVDERHDLTRRDITERNQDLLDAAQALL